MIKTRYVAVSVLAHAAVLAVGLHWVLPRFAIPAPALHLTLEGEPAPAVAAHAPPPRPVHVVRHGLAPAPAIHRQRAESDPPATKSTAARSGTPAPPNNLLSLVYAALAHHFVYPPLARKLGWQGEVYVDVCLEPDGRLHAVRIVRSSGHRLLDRDAFDTLSRIGVIPQARTHLHGHSYAFTLPVTYKLVDG